MAQAFTFNFPYELDKSIDKVFYDKLDKGYSEYEKIAKIMAPVPGSTYVSSEVSGLGSLELIPENGIVPYDTPVEGNKISRGYQEFGLGFRVTKRMLDDNIHGNILKMPGALGAAAKQNINTQFFSLLNDGDDTHLAKDSKYIFANDHATLKSATTIDNLVASDLSETSLQAAFEYFDKVKSSSGYPTMMSLDMIIVPVESRWIASKLYNGDKVLGSANNDLLTTNPANKAVGGWEFMVSKYLTDTDSWFALSKEHGLTILWKQKPQLTSADDFDTQARKYQVRSRYSVFCNDYEGVYGSYGA